MLNYLIHFLDVFWETFNKKQENTMINLNSIHISNWKFKQDIPYRNNLYIIFQ